MRANLALLLCSFSLRAPPSLRCCPSLTTLTPLYHEDVMYEVKATGDDTNGITALLSSGAATGGRDELPNLDLIAYLQTVYEREFEHFQHRCVRDGRSVNTGC